MPSTSVAYFAMPLETALHPLLLESKEEESISLKYPQKPDSHYPFDRYEAYRIRLLSFLNAALYILRHDTQLSASQVDAKQAALQKLKEQKLHQLDEFKQVTQLHSDEISFNAELYHFYHNELPQTSGYDPEQLALAESFFVWQERGRQQRITKYTREIYDQKKYLLGYLRITQKDTPSNSKLTESQKTELLRIHQETEQPKWFQNLKPWAQNALKAIVPTQYNGDWEAYEQCRPSALRHIPGDANASLHELEIEQYGFSQNASSITHYSSEKQGVPTSFNMKDKTERQNSANENLSQMLSLERIQNAKHAFIDFWGLNNNTLEVSIPVQFPILLGGLVTPREQAGLVSSLLDLTGASGDENNTRLAREKESALAHMLNAYYPGSHTQQSATLTTAGNPDDCHYFFNLNVAINGALSIPVIPDAGFIEFLEQFHTNYSALLTHQTKTEPDNPKLKKRSDQLRILKAVINRLVNLTAEEVPGRNRNLFLAALYELAIRAMCGLATGHCKSTKDRKAMQLTQADAFSIYLEEDLAAGVETLELPAFDNEGSERARLVDIFCELYASGHQLLIAHDNSPGSAGIKDEGILDADMIAALQRMQFNPLSDSLAPINPKDARGLYAQSKQVAEFNKPGSFWKKYGGRIARYSAFTLATLAVGLSLILMATGVLSPLGIIGAAAAAKLGAAATAIGATVNVSVSALGAVTLTALACKVKDRIEAHEDAKNTFAAQLAKMSHQLKENQVSASSSTTARAQSCFNQQQSSPRLSVDPENCAVSKVEEEDETTPLLPRLNDDERNLLFGLDSELPLTSPQRDLSLKP